MYGFLTQGISLMVNYKAASVCTLSKDHEVPSSSPTLTINHLNHVDLDTARFKKKKDVRFSKLFSIINFVHTASTYAHGPSWLISSIGPSACQVPSFIPHASTADRIYNSYHLYHLYYILNTSINFRYVHKINKSIFNFQSFLLKIW